MYISKIYIKKFRVFEEIQLNFSKHITCIAGHNGIGKSTILALLGNCGELKKKDAQHINGNQFRAELSQIITGDKNFDVTGDTYELFFSELPKTTNPSNPYVDRLKFRATFQSYPVKKTHYKKLKDEKNLYKKVTQTDKLNRFRLIPKKIPTVRETEKKLNWPVYYLGLSRLYPIGESEESKSESIPSHLQNKINLIHKKILRSSDNYVSSKSISLSDAKNKKGITISTDSYSSSANSSGQDNLGQIIATIVSFEEMKKKMGEQYAGGLFLIDEIDATLHPVAQNELIKYLINKSIELNLQIVFTTHSLSLLEHIININNYNIFHKDAIKTIYLYKSNGYVNKVYNPSLNFLKNDLTLTINTNVKSEVKVLTEDDATRWLLKKILEAKNINFNLKFIESQIGWTNILGLIKEDYNYFKHYLIILDPDVSEPNNLDTLKRTLNGTKYNYNSKNGNIFVLPGQMSIEKMMWNYVSNLDENHKIFSHDLMKSIPLTKALIINTGPFEDIKYQNYKEDRHKVKIWFNNMLHDYLNVAVEFWIKDNEKLVNDFISKFSSSYHKIIKGL